MHCSESEIARLLVVYPFVVTSRDTKEGDRADSFVVAPSEDSEFDVFLREAARLPRAPRWVAPPAIGEFRLVRVIGRGGMGAVWLARDTLLERDVAVKIGEVASAQGLLRSHVEARAIARLRHPNIVTIHHAGEIDDRPMVVTELLSGSSLDRLSKPLPGGRAIAIGADLARGLSAAHAAGVVHRDIKPANAFLCDGGVAKLLDFGIAQIREPALGPTEGGVDLAAAAAAPGEAPSGPVGTPLYMAPESWRREAASPGTDVYSLGALLYELLAGKPAHSGRTTEQVRAMALGAGPEDLATAASWIPPELARLVMRCLDGRVGARPSAEEVCFALERMMGSPLEASSAPPSDPGDNPYRGLLAFGPEHHALFFGRETETAAVLDAVRASPFVLVVAPSGAGKSSVVRAGVVPRAGVLEPATDWRAALMTPGQRPQRRLAQALASAVGEPPGDPRSRSGPLSSSLRDPRSRSGPLSSSLRDPHVGGPTLAEWVRDAIARRGARGRLLLVVDQLEEAWTLSSNDERRAFFESLHALTRLDEVRIVATLRSDFLSRLEDFGALRAWALRAPVVLGPLAGDALRRAIVEPARARGVDVQPTVVHELMAAAAGGSLGLLDPTDAAGALPLLQFALAALWDRRDPSSRVLDHAALATLGGLEGALAVHADATLAQMAPGRRAEARRLLLALLTTDRTRARREESDLRLTSADATGALASLVEARLVVASAGDDGPAYAIAHEALVSGWPTLHGWVEEEAVSRAAAERLSRAASEWVRLGRMPEALFGERQLVELQEIGTQPSTPNEAAFLDESRAAVRRSRRRRVLFVIGAPLSCAVAVSAAWAVVTSARHQAVARLVQEAHDTDAHAQDIAREADDARSRSLARFEADDPEPAEDLWKRALELEEVADRQRRNAGAKLDAALLREPRDPAARALYADVLLARVQAAQRRYESDVVPELLARLAQYDDGQTREARLHAPGTIRFETPGVSSLTLWEYRDHGDGRLVEEEVGPVDPQIEREISPGSYLLVAGWREGGTTRYPFVVDLGEVRTLQVAPPPAETPPNMVYVPAGRFLYGGGGEELARAWLTHQPLHAVDLHAFFVARTEVTNADYLAFLRALPERERSLHAPPDFTFAPDGHLRFLVGQQRLLEGQPLCVAGQPCSDWLRWPINILPRDEAQAYAAWLSRSGRVPGARLCTDREWERAARGADARRFPWGDGNPRPDDACGGTSGDRRTTPCEVGAHPSSRSPFGVDDMAGNVSEWTAMDVDREHPGLGIYRGGNYESNDQHLEIPNRAMQSHLVHVGARLCADAP
jgi:formylglycine-generating enzyme required for sulfatase activity